MMKDRFVFNKYIKTCFFISLLTICGCGLRGINLKDMADNRFKITANVENTPLREVGSIVVCRSKQCAPAKLSMSSQYIFNSLLHLFENNNHKKMLVCQANPSSRTCLENYITLPIKVGITPAYMYIDSVKITDVIINKGTNTLNLILNYNVTYNGQTPDCTPAESVLYVRNINHILLEDPGYNCKMTTVGTTNIKTIFVIDYIDLDYGFIGGYYSLGLSGPAYGGGTGYMLLRLPKNAYPLDPELMAPTKKKKNAAKNTNQSASATDTSEGLTMTMDVQADTARGLEEETVEVFPLPNKKQ